MVNGVTWQGWEPGREYTKNIFLKNTKVKTQKLKYRVPGSRFFSTLYPKPVVLSAGTSFTLPVTFRPLEKIEYKDCVEFFTNEGRFVVPVEAVLPRVNIDIPAHINFQMCAVHDTIQLTFDINNVSELVTPFHVESADPFFVEPKDGILEPFASFVITATFKPKAALVYEMLAVVRYGPNLSSTKTTQLEGIGKYPHLLVKSSGVPLSGETEATIKFGCVSVGQTVERWIELHNLSPVNAPFTIEQPVGPTRIDKVFNCPQREGVIPALKAIRIPMTFNPNTVGSKSTDYFHVKAIGNISKTVLKCVGHSKGPMVRLSHEIINFQQINQGQSCTRTVDIINESETDAMFQFMVDCNESAFKFDHISGTLPPHSRKTVLLRFHPTHPISYYKTVTCLIHNQDPVFLDLIGTCHSETVKPAVLQPKHIRRYHAHVDRGFSFIPPEQLNDMLREGQLQADENGALYNNEASLEPVSSVLPMDKFFNDGYYSDITHYPPHVSTDIYQADFGQCMDMRNIEQRTVNITNHTKGKVTVYWMGGEDHVFTMTPQTLDIPPLKSCSFRVSFKPSAPNQFYGAELECYASFKSMRDYRLTEDTTLTPPWCLTVTATGHTFMSNQETFLPRYHLDSPQVVFPAVNATESTYRTVLLSNTGTTPILYDFDRDNTGIYSVKPTKGLVWPTQHQVFVMKILPTEVKAYKHILKLRLNDAEKHTQDIHASGSAESAQILLENAGEVYFKPTCVGTVTSQQYGVKNMSRIPLRFEWKMHHADAQVLEIEPSSGVIQPNENQFHTWYFKPRLQDKHMLKPALIVWGHRHSSKSSAGRKREFAVRAIGEGSLGRIQCEEKYMDYGTIVVGSSETRYITLVNDSNCSLHYRLDVGQTISGPYAEEQTQLDACALELDRTEGVLPARSKHVIEARARPSRRVYYQWVISYQLLTPEGRPAPSSPTESQHLCHILATGVYPALTVTDAHCYGSAIGISKKQLWALFSLDDLNVCLDADPSEQELFYATVTKRSYKRRPPVQTRAILDFNFNAAPLNSAPCMVQLVLENTGPVASEWAFLFPSDLQLELEYWAETGDFDEEELHEMKVMNNKLFTVEPRIGQLDPGQRQTVTLTYRHIMAGTDRLPVLLKLTRGREILLNFVGVTVEPERRYIHFPSNKHMFTPVPIGENHSPKQIYEVYNGGALPVKYEFDLTPLKAVQEENFDHAIFECLNPVGEILPGQSATIEWLFSPLEAKTYCIDIPITIHNEDLALLTFTGVGYDRHLMGDTMPLIDQQEVNGVPSTQSAAIPGQLAYLSQERITFGNMPLFCKVRRVVGITNSSAEHAQEFMWHVTANTDSQYVNITPSHGTLEPGEVALCTITFVSRGVPAFYDLDLVCDVFNMTDYTEYRRQLCAWQNEEERQKVEFSITEDNVDADECLPNVKSRPPSGCLKSLPGARTPSPETDLAKYTTLPPIKQTTVAEESRRQKYQKRFEKKYWAKPLPPKPFLLHLGVTCRTHGIDEYQQNFSEEYKHFCIDRLLGSCKLESDQQQLIMNAPPDYIHCNQMEADVLHAALTTIIRGLLDDVTFQEACRKVMEEPTPYFQQFTERSPACPTQVPEGGGGTSSPAGSGQERVNSPTTTSRTQDGLISPHRSG